MLMVWVNVDLYMALKAKSVFYRFFLDFVFFLLFLVFCQSWTQKKSVFLLLFLRLKKVLLVPLAQWTGCIILDGKLVYTIT